MIDPLVGARAIHFATTAIAAGVIFFECFVGEPVFHRASNEYLSPIIRLRTRLTLIASIALALALISGIAWLLLLSADISGHPWTQVFDDDTPWIMLTQTQLGRDWITRFILMWIVAGLLRYVAFGKKNRLNGITVLAAAGLMGSLAWAGHAGATPGLTGDIQLAADVLHLLAASAWIGGLIPLALALGYASEMPVGVVQDITYRFSILGAVSVAVLFTTGTINTWILAGAPPQLIGTIYGRLLLVKITVFLIMVGFACVNHWRLAPKLANNIDGAITVGRLRRNCFNELVLGLLIVTIVGVLGTLPPARHTQASWPFPVRFDAAALTDPQLRIQAAVAIAATTIGGLAVLAGIFYRRLRWPAVIIGIAMLAYFGPNLGLLTTKAFPTSFYISPTGYTAQSIVRGKAVFLQSCARCHGNEGHGDGPDSVNLKSDHWLGDLASNRIYELSDGDLFGIITGGMGEMPGFSASLNETARWNLIDYLHAQADAFRAGRIRSDKAATAFPMPDFGIACGEQSMSIEQLQGHALHLILAGPRTTGRMRDLMRLDLENHITSLIVPLDQAASMGNMLRCTVRDPDIAATLALFLGKNTSKIDGAEFLIDEQGRLRSLWYPGLSPDWNDSAAFGAFIDKIRRTEPISERKNHHAHAH